MLKIYLRKINHHRMPVSGQLKSQDRIPMSLKNEIKLVRKIPFQSNFHQEYLYR